jgi:hypothetical protein
MNNIPAGESVIRRIVGTNVPWNTRQAFWPLTLRFLFLGGAVLDGFLYISGKLGLSVQHPQWFIYALLIGPVLYWFAFFGEWLWFNVRISQKTNIVLAYNFEAVKPSVYQRYETFVRELENKIRERDLGSKIRIHTKPADIRFETHTAAEAKTKLGLVGATLVIWGHASRKKNRTAFVTNFSYEFVYPGALDRKVAARTIGSVIDTGLGGGLFGPSKYEFHLDGDTFGEHSLATSLFILGTCAVTCGDRETALDFLGEFRRMYQRADLLRQTAMRPAVKIAEGFLMDLHEDLAMRAELDEEYSEIEQHAEAILGIDRDSYRGNLLMALCSERNGDRNAAKHFTEQAAIHAKADDQAHKFNPAYFALADNDYDSAIRVYEGIPTNKPLNVNGIRIFLYNKFKDLNDPAFLFGDAFVAYRWQNGSKESLHSFLNTVNQRGDKAKYSVLITKATELINGGGPL